MTITNILSALGNNNSIYPLFVRDCCIENVAKVGMTYKQNAKDSKFIARQATRECAIEEYGTSLIWLGGIPVIETIADKLIEKSGFSSKISTKLLKGTKAQNLEKNIELFKNTATKEVGDLSKVQANLSKFKNLQKGKFLASTVIPIAIMGFVLPKLNFKLTEKKLKENKENKTKTTIYPQIFIGIDEFIKTKTTIYPQIFIRMDEFIKKNNQPSFKGNLDLLSITGLQKMMILDGGLTVGRVGTARGAKEKTEKLFKMLGMCYLNYRAPKKIEKGLNFLTRKIFGVNTGLDPKVLKNNSFIDEIKENKLLLPKELDEENILKFLDTNPKSTLSQIAQEQNIVSYLKTGIRDPRKFVETDKVKELINSIQEFMSDAKKSGSIENFAKKAYIAKGFNIVANVLISSFLLAIALPKILFLFRSIFTGTNLDPGVSEAMKNKQN